MSRKFQNALLNWYDAHRRALPWRALPGQIPNPYHVWLSEIMLQQTTVPAVIPYFEKFLKTWPCVKDLADADQDDVMAAWAGLGYYARARNLYKCANVIAYDLSGVFPAEESALLQLPGIGPYTAAAIAAIAFDRQTVPVDANIERVSARVQNITEPLPASKQAIQTAASELGQGCKRPGDFAQALMGMGSSICTAGAPKCDLCPVQAHCMAHQSGAPEKLPVKAPKQKKPTRYGVAYWMETKTGEVLLEKRPAKGLLGGMYGFPSTEWTETSNGMPAPVSGKWAALEGHVKHTFTHFHLELSVCYVSGAKAGDYVPVCLSEIPDYPLPTVMKKVVKHVIKHQNIMNNKTLREIA